MSMANQSIRRRLRNRETLLGTWIQLGHPGIGEILANAGFDWIAADCEHSDIDIAGFTGVARGMSGSGTALFARVRENDTLAIRQVLDAGAAGVIVPLVNTAEEAAKAVRAAKFPPEGIRGFAFTRANRWGVDFDSYAAGANNEVAVIVMIESGQAVENIDEIMEVDGVDGIFIGPYDMSGSYGITGQTSHPLVQAACKRVADSCRSHGKSAGIHIVKPGKESFLKAGEDGFGFVALGMDTVFLDMTARNTLREAKDIFIK